MLGIRLGSPKRFDMVALIGPLATIHYELRQARKGATVVVDLCAEVWLVRVISISRSPFLLHSLSINRLTFIKIQAIMAF